MCPEVGANTNISREIVQTIHLFSRSRQNKRVLVLRSRFDSTCLDRKQRKYGHEPLDGCQDHHIRIGDLYNLKGLSQKGGARRQQQEASYVEEPVRDVKTSSLFSYNEEPKHLGIVIIMSIPRKPSLTENAAVNETR